MTMAKMQEGRLSCTSTFQTCPHLMVKAHHTANIKGEEVGSVSSNRNCTLTWQASSHVKSEAREE